MKSIQFLRNVYKRNIGTMDNGSVIDDFVKLLRFLIKCLLLECGFCAMSYASSPLLIYICTGELEPIFPWYLPGTKPNSTVDYIQNLPYQSFANYSAAGIFTFFDAMFTFQMVHVTLLSNILRSKIWTINQMVTDKNPSSTMNVRINLRNLILLQKEMLS